MRLTIILIILLLPFAGIAHSPQDSIGTTTKKGNVFILHRVEAGETLYKIAKFYKIKVEAIQKENPSTSTLAIGQQLLIPTSQKASPGIVKTHKVAKGETLYAIAKKYTITVEQLNSWNDLTDTDLKLGQTLYVSAPIADKTASQRPIPKSATTHEVTAGESLYAISKKHGVTIEHLKKINKLNSNELSVGQILTIRASTPNATKKPPRTSVIPVDNVKKPQRIATNPTPITYKKEEQSGSIAFTGLTQFNTKYSYGLHKTAPVGTVIKVTNTTTGKFRWVRIMGALESSDASIMRVNKTVMEHLGEGAISFEGTISFVL